MSSMGDPSYGVHRDLLPHVHLISTYRYTLKARVEPNEVTNWLMQAPKIARDTAPFFWTYLDRPENGNIFLTWQPSQQMGANFASDGFIWPPQEQFMQQEVGNGVILEVYYHKAGFAYNEHFATHSRRRFRLIPPTVHTPNASTVDPSLWIVHYGPVENNERIPSALIPQNNRTHAMLETRAYLQRCGQIQRKEFILGDRINWPQIAWPREPSRQPMFAGARGVPQGMAYPSHPPAAGAPPSKRARTGQAAQGQVPPAMAAIPPDNSYDDEEDTSRGDMFDHLTPREVSLARYRQNHEWMEEILSSPYRMGQIGFSDLGLGLKGELSSLTNGIFEAHDRHITEKPSKSSATQLGPEQATEFRKRVADRIESTQAAIEKIKSEHAKKVAKFERNSILTTAERELRLALGDPGSNSLQLERDIEEGEDSSNRWSSKHSKRVDEIVSQVEAHLGRRAEVIYDLRRIQDGGYQEPAPEPAPQPVAGPGPGPQNGGTNGSGAMSRQPSQTGSQHSGFMIGDSDIDMGGTAAGLLDQIHTGTGASSISTPANNFPTPQAQTSAIHSNVATPANLNVPSPRQPPQKDETGDIKMDGTGNTESLSGTAPDQGTGSGDWVVVPKGGAIPDGPANPASANNAPKAIGHLSKQGSATGTPSAGFDGDQNDFSSLDDLNTAGDALAGFSETPGDLGEGLDLDMEDSAFGDAFHGVDSQQGGTPAEGNM
ncbi:DUF1750-domain-containing protein [Annulohypoxylon maeteangense]|uniref:DUF1750-domain-containing protein n=1 Tax=Annulohypoxylon maeteangense TaxID=1927788 RepID=UPI002008BDDF|nr:DUF1750-domain-containing protein [Annulohypoxylon maeteangense]KAI0889134.1 DUF1750-domain-containing protein [Annulohypoxylon maeteangense]